ncbi:MAG: penicillin-binding protein activator LpoB [Acaryochloris sp. RU_4_1]|nr:penicillin-binding protein activator LpoB [Acaryochloris sp. RU_4_1]NJN39239.1 penicillin-binding protein activator LpoB [Acaryochloridaceae cyanobacterium CSU_3_4]NJR57087.1 penicillin-binding protein activator LpoB [Acaryochloris sp. CRU_2_0]
MNNSVLPIAKLSIAKLSIALTLLTAFCVPGSVYANPLQTPGVGVEQIKVKESRRIAVLDFDYANVSKTGVSYGLYSNNGASKGISNLLTNSLVKDGTYVLVERSKIDAILAEQNLGQSGRIEPTTAAQIGRILGVDAVLIGSITQFHVEEQAKGGSIGGFFGLGGKQKKQLATVQLSTRLVSTATGEILTAAEGTGQADKSEGQGSIFGVGVDSDSDSSERLLGVASSQAVDKIVAQLAAVAPKLSTMPATLPVQEMVVADITGNQITLNKGGVHGFRPGMVVSVERVIKDIKDPTTGKVLRRQTQSVGRIQLTEVDAQSSVGKILTGTGFKVGDVAKAVQ